MVELDRGPDECHDEQDPDQSTQTSDGRHHIGTALKEEYIPLENLPLSEACFAADETTVVDAFADGRFEYELSSSCRHGSKRSEPQDHHEAIEDQYGKDVVRAVAAGDLLGDENISNDDPGDEANGERETELVEIGIVHETASQTDDDQAQEKLETPNHGNPNGRL